MNESGGDVRQVTFSTSGNEGMFGLAWSPDGRRIAYESSRNGNTEIYVSNIDGTGEQRLTTSSSSDQAPGWSPDGRFIAFESDRTGNFEIWVLEVANPRNVFRLTTTPGNRNSYGPNYSPDGSQILFFTNRDGKEEPYLMNPDGSSQRPLLSSRRSGTDDKAAKWSPDGSQIAFFSNSGVGGKWVIFTVYADGSGLRQITSPDISNTSPSWSPDGTRLIYVSERGDQALYMINVDGSNERRISTGSGHAGNPAWYFPPGG